MALRMNQGGTLSQPYQLANDSELRLLLGYTSPPRAGKITAYSGGKYTVEIADGDDAVVEAIALNEVSYAVGNIVYVLQAANAPESGVIIGCDGYPTKLAIGKVNPTVELDVGGDAAISGDIDIAGAMSVNGLATFSAGMGLHAEKDCPHNSATDVCRVVFPSMGQQVATFLVNAQVTGTGRLAAASYIVCIAYNQEGVAELTKALFAFNSVNLTASHDTGNRRTTLTVTQTNGASQTCTAYLSIVPLFTWSDDPLSITQL